ncbi:organic solute transporter subunit alpha [Cherax quadricarinatus]
MDQIQNLFSQTDCNKSYVPTAEEYHQALGSYGTALLAIGGLITVGLYILFFEQAFFTLLNAHRIFRRHIYWIASVYPFMALMSVIATVVPRAHNICTSVKITYMAIGISHFTDLTVLMFGSEAVMLAKTEGKKLNLQVGPSCCCCCCLPSPPVTKFSLRLVMLMVDQLPFSQAAYYITILILISADIITLGNVNPSGVYLWLSLFNLIFLMGGVYALQILTTFSRGHLERYNYTAKSFSMKTLVLVTNLQSLILDIMANYGAFPCISPYLPPQVYKQTVENSIYLLEMMVLGSYTYWHYHNRKFLYSNPSEVEHIATSKHSSVGSMEGSNDNSDINLTTSTKSTILEMNFGDVNETHVSDNNSKSTYRFYDVTSDTSIKNISNSSITNNNYKRRPTNVTTLTNSGNLSPVALRQKNMNTAPGQREYQERFVVAGDLPCFVVHRSNDGQDETVIAHVDQKPSSKHRSVSRVNGGPFQNTKRHKERITLKFSPDNEHRSSATHNSQLRRASY